MRLPLATSKVKNGPAYNKTFLLTFINVNKGTVIVPHFSNRYFTNKL